MTFKHMQLALNAMAAVHGGETVTLEADGKWLYAYMSSPTIGVASKTSIKFAVDFEPIVVDYKALLAALRVDTPSIKLSNDVLSIGKFKLTARLNASIDDFETSGTDWDAAAVKVLQSSFVATNTGDNPPSVFGWEALATSKFIYCGSTTGSIAVVKKVANETGVPFDRISIPPAALKVLTKLLAKVESLSVKSTINGLILKADNHWHAIAVKSDDAGIHLEDLIEMVNSREDILPGKASKFTTLMDDLSPFFTQSSSTVWTLKDGELNVAIESHIGSTSRPAANGFDKSHKATFSVHVKQIAGLTLVSKPEVILCMRDASKTATVSRLMYRDPSNGLHVILPCST